VIDAENRVFQRNRRQADIADRGSGRPSWAESTPTTVTSGKTGMRHSPIPLRVRKRLRRPKQAFIEVPAASRRRDSNRPGARDAGLKSCVNTSVTCRIRNLGFRCPGPFRGGCSVPSLSSLVVTGRPVNPRGASLRQSRARSRIGERRNGFPGSNLTCALSPTAQWFSRSDWRNRLLRETIGGPLFGQCAPAIEEIASAVCGFDLV
jgi:hypothetical protein